jgi:hypothetical protein
MKKTVQKISLIIGLLVTTQANAQVSVANNAAGGGNYVGWNNTVGVPLQIRHNADQEIHTFTNNLRRMIIANGGGTGNPGGNVALGNNLGAGFVPVDRLHLNNRGATSSLFTGIRYTNFGIGMTSTDGTQMGINTDGIFFHRQFETEPIIWELPDSRNAGAMTNWMHISNGLTGYAGDITDGFIGLNEDSAKFHLDIKTPAIPNTGSSFGGELFLSCRTSDVPDSRMGMLNISGGNGVFVPTLFGNLDASQSGPPLSSLAVIHQDQDVSSNNIPVQRFLVGKDWEYNTNAVDAITEIENRNAFSWQNVNNTKMLMNAMGRLKIQNNLSLSDTILIV